MARPSPLVPFVLALLAPGLAWAGGTAVVTPLVSKGVDEKVTRNLTGLISSELDFSGAFDTVNELSQAPSTLNASCVASTSCLASIAKTAGADTVVTGTVAPGSKGVSVTLVFFDAKKGAIVKNKSWEIETSVASQAESAPRMVKELLGTSSPAMAAAQEVEKVSMDTEEENDFSFSDSSKPKTKMTPTSKTTSKVALEDLPDDEEELDAKYAAAEAAKAKAKADADAKAKAAAEAAVRAEADRKAKAEAEAKAKAAAESAAKAEADRKAKALADAERREREEAEAQARADAAAAKSKADASKKSTPVPALVDDELEEDPVEEPVAKKPSTSTKTTTTAKAKPPEEMSDEELEAQLAGFKLGGTVEEPVATTTSSTKSTPAAKPAPKVVVEDPDEDLAALEDEESGSGKSVASLDDEDEPPVAKSKSKYSDDEEEEPKPKAKSKSSYDDEDEPKAKAKSKSWDDEEEEPKPKAKAKSSYDEDEDEPKAKSKSRYDEDEEEPKAKSKSRYDEDEDEPKRSSRYDDDEPRTKSKSKYDDDEPRKNHVELTARAGYSRYDNFNFVNYGGELAIPVAGGVFAMVGLEGASTNRGYTDVERKAIADQNGISPDEVEDWNTILPFNLGVQYKATAKKVQPYGGADLTITPYTANFDVAFGARARGGVDFLVSDNFGINLDLALGFMSGEKLQYVAPGVPNIGFQPRLCVGTVIAF